MTNDERWQQIEVLLNVESKRRTKWHGEELRGHLGELLATADGRESIRSRFSSGSGFAGKAWFLRECVRTAEDVAEKLAEIPGEERRDLFHEFLRQSRPKADQSHWDALWLLHREGFANVGQEVFNSLGKVAPKKADLVQALSTLPSWQGFPRERAAVLLQVAKQRAASAKDAARIEQALQWVSTRVSPASEAPSDGQSGSSVSPTATPTTAGETAPALGGRRLSIPEARVGEGEEDDAPSIMDRSGERSTDLLAPPKYPPASVADRDVRELVARISGLIESFLLSQAAHARQLEQEATTARAQAGSLRDQLSLTQHRLASLEESLQQEMDVTKELHDEKLSLEHRLEDRERALASIEGEVERLNHNFGQMQEQIEATRRRTEDYIRQSDRERDSAVRTFQAKLWETMRHCLVEVLEEPADETSLSADQRFFRKRLREIKAVLHDAGVPPLPL